MYEKFITTNVEKVRGKMQNTINQIHNSRVLFIKFWPWR